MLQHKQQQQQAAEHRQDKLRPWTGFYVTSKWSKIREEALGEVSPVTSSVIWRSTGAVEVSFCLLRVDPNDGHDPRDDDADQACEGRRSPGDTEPTIPPLVDFATAVGRRLQLEAVPSQVETVVESFIRRRLARVKVGFLLVSLQTPDGTLWHSPASAPRRLRRAQGGVHCQLAEARRRGSSGIREGDGV